MGCCESRDYKKNLESANMQSPVEPKELALEALILKITNLTSIGDSKAENIFNHVNELRKQTNWAPVILEPTVSATKLERSKFSNEFIVTNVKINLELKVPLKIILDLMLISEQRLKWDSVLEHLEVIEGNDFHNITYKRIKVLFYTAEFIDRQIVTTFNNNVYIITYSTGEDIVRKDQKYARAHTFMGVFEISEINGNTELAMINQVDPKSKMSFLAGSWGITNQKFWIQRLKDKIYQTLYM